MKLIGPDAFQMRLFGASARKAVMLSRHLSSSYHHYSPPRPWHRHSPRLIPCLRRLAREHGTSFPHVRTTSCKMTRRGRFMQVQLRSSVLTLTLVCAARGYDLRSRLMTSIKMQRNCQHRCWRNRARLDRPDQRNSER